MTAHYGTQSHKPRRTPDAWLRLNTQIGEMVNRWSRRNDLMTYIGDDGGQGMAAAFFDPQVCEIEVNTKEAFGEHADPALIGDFTERKTQFEWSQASGLIMHEAMHARFSTVRPKVVYDAVKAASTAAGLDKETEGYAQEAYVLMDESRIEGCGVAVLPKNAAFLRTSANYLMRISPEDAAKQHPMSLALRLLLLGYARVDAGVLKKADILPVRVHVDKIISAADRKVLRRIWRDFQNQNDRRSDEFDRMVKLSVEWAQIEKRLRDEWKKEHPEEEQSEEQQALMEAMMEALGQAGELAQMRGEAEGQAQQAEEKAEAEAKAKAEDEKEQKDNRDEASKVFGNKRSNGATDLQTRTRRSRTRQPTVDERKTAQRVANAMKKAKYRDRLRTEKLTEAPPGRLRTRAAMQQAAARSQGRVVQVDAFKQIRRHHVEDPNLTVGIMCDISGSMGAAMEPLGVAAWIMAEATRRIKGTAAQTYFGNSVFPVLRPGETPKEINIYDATDGHEAFDSSFRAIDGTLNLLNGEGARLLVVCSDGQFKMGEDERTLYWLKKAQARGVAVIWLAFKDAWAAKGICDKTGAHYVEIGTRPVEAAEVIAKACLDSLTKASAKR